MIDSPARSSLTGNESFATAAAELSRRPTIAALSVVLATSVSITDFLNVPSFSVAVTSNRTTKKRTHRAERTEANPLGPGLKGMPSLIARSAKRSCIPLRTCLPGALNLWASNKGIANWRISTSRFSQETQRRTCSASSARSPRVRCPSCCDRAQDFEIVVICNHSVPRRCQTLLRKGPSRSLLRPRYRSWRTTRLFLPSG